ncbi:MAG: hypothetical protein BWY59_01756 [Verrucomicrobia bacterium ADurb.Bin345]|nr:MAG: hypothetical protein BWY59_01756 [Verrucomicrobia bacterium ADurb.Bin345]
MSPGEYPGAAPAGGPERRAARPGPRYARDLVTGARLGHEPDSISALAYPQGQIVILEVEQEIGVHQARFAQRVRAEEHRAKGGEFERPEGVVAAVVGPLGLVHDDRRGEAPEPRAGRPQHLGRLVVVDLRHQDARIGIPGRGIKEKPEGVRVHQGVVVGHEDEVGAVAERVSETGIEAARDSHVVLVADHRDAGRPVEDAANLVFGAPVVHVEDVKGGSGGLL